MSVFQVWNQVSKRRIQVPPGQQHLERFRLRRWIHLAALGWFSGDHHIHAAGCAHYAAPSQGVDPSDMMRHILGEDLKKRHDEKGDWPISKPARDKPYWHVERARIGDTRQVAVELIVNGESVDQKLIEADGRVEDVRFNYTPERSSWPIPFPGWTTLRR